MAKESTQHDGTPQGAPFWDRINSLFTRQSARQRFEEEPQRRGMAVTMAILVSSLLWFTFTMREMHTKMVQMPTEVVNLPETQALSQLPPENVRVQVVGDGWSLMRLRFGPPTIPVNAAEQEVSIRDAIPELPKNVEIQSVSPATLNLWKEHRITRKVPVDLRAQFETPETFYLIDDATVMPDSVEVSGAASVVGDLEAWPTVSMTFENVRDTMRTRIALSDTLSRLVQKNVASVSIYAVSKQFTEGMKEIDVTVQGQPSSQTLVTLEPSSITVKYRVMISQFQEAQDAMDFYATVSYEEIRGDTTGRIRPHVHVPQYLEIRDVEKIPETLGYYERID